MNRSQFISLLAKNTGIIVLKVGADWCQPCKDLDRTLKKIVPLLPSTVIYVEQDLESDLGSFLNAKKQITAVPVFLVYRKNNLTPYADESLTGPSEEQVYSLFSSLIKKSTEVVKP